MADLYFENGFCIYASTRDPRDPPDVLPGCGAIVPKAHRASPFDLTAEEWAATRELLVLIRAELHKRLAPDGYTLGWNDQDGLHPHLRSVIPRFDDEPMAGHAASGRGSRILPTGGPIRGVPAPGSQAPAQIVTAAPAGTGEGGGPAAASGTAGHPITVDLAPRGGAVTDLPAGAWERARRTPAGCCRGRGT